MNNPILSVRGVAVHFGGLKAVDGATFEVEEGSVTALIGPNGAGKTTLFNLISGAYKPNAGYIFFNSEPIQDLRSHEIAQRGLVRTFQSAKVIRRISVMENMLLAAQSNPGDKLWRLLTPRVRKNFESEARVKAMDLLQQVGLASMHGDFAGILSGGQRKLLDLARALMANPKMLLLDEPFAGVNSALVEKLLEVLKSLRSRGDLSFLFVEHDLEAVMNLSDKVVVMAQGRVIAEGKPDGIYDNEVVVEAYLGSRKRGG